MTDDSDGLQYFLSYSEICHSDADPYSEDNFFLDDNQEIFSSEISKENNDQNLDSNRVYHTTNNHPSNYTNYINDPLISTIDDPSQLHHHKNILCKLPEPIFKDDDIIPERDKFPKDVANDCFTLKSPTSEEGLVYQSKLESPFNNVEDLIKYLSRVVLVGHLNKLNKSFKIIIYQVIQEFVFSHYQNLSYDQIEKLNREDKRSVQRLDIKLFKIKNYIYELFESKQKNKIVLDIIQQVYNQCIKKIEAKLQKEQNAKIYCKNYLLLKEYQKEIDKISAIMKE